MASVIFKWLQRCLFICFCAFFLMSHNASAVDVSINATPTGAGTACMSVFQSTNPPVSTSIQCNLVQNTNTDTYFTFKTSLSIPGTYYSDTVMTLDFTIYKNSNSTSNHANINGVSIYNYVDTGWRLLSYDYQQLDTNTGKLRLVLKSIANNVSFNGISFTGSNGGWLFGLNPGERLAGVNYTIYAINDANAGTQQIVNAINSMPNYSNNLNQINNGINNINNDVEDATQDAADAAADSGDQSAADAENATAGLISVIGGFVNAITTASPTNCKINGKINNSFNMGELDLCAMPVPSFVQIISSLILIAICIPFAIVMFNRFIGLFRSFQG